MTKVLLEGPVLMNPHLRRDRFDAVMPSGYRMMQVSVPEGVGRGARPEVYDEYRNGLDGACVDIVVTTLTPQGMPAVIASKRSKDKPFGGVWWMQGGAAHAYRSYEEFVVERAAKECGARPIIQGLVGVFRTCAEDGVASTLQLCYAGWVHPSRLQGLVADNDHSGVRLLTLGDLDALPAEECHWYPDMVFRRALNTMPPFHHLMAAGT